MAMCFLSGHLFHQELSGLGNIDDDCVEIEPNCAICLLYL